MTVAVTLLGLALIVVMVKYKLLKKELDRMTAEVKQIITEQRNTLLSVELPEKQVVSLAIAINELNDNYQEKIQEYQQQSEEFKQSMANISHDLRTPLTALSGYLNLMAEEKNEKDNSIEDKDNNKEKQEQYLKVACEKAEVLNYLVTSLFELARIESHTYPFDWKRINLTELLANELVSFYPEFLRVKQEPNIRITEEALWIRSDAIALQRIFNNLLQNAINHGEGVIEIKASQKDSEAFVEISNLAKDLTKEDVTSLFTHSYKKELARSRSGAGLGLAITKAFVESMEGSIGAYLEAGRLVIEVRLPRLRKGAK